MVQVFIFLFLYSVAVPSIPVAVIKLRVIEIFLVLMKIFGLFDAGIVIYCQIQSNSF